MKVIVPVVLVFVAIAVLCAHTNLPWSDEAWFASPAYNLITKGNFGTSVLDPTASFRTNNLSGIREHTYWIVPLFPLAEAAWFRAVGFGLMQVRYLSILWGLVALWAWYRMLKILSGDERVALLALGLMTVDFTFAYTASVGRMDMMAAALGGAGLTAFLVLRERNFTRAVLVSQSLIVAAGLTHPMAFGYCCGLFALTLYSDWRRIRIPHVLVAAAPYVAGAIGWGIYIMQAPHDFMLQFGGNAAERGLPITDPMAVFHSQVMVRFLYMFGMAPDTRGFSHIKILILVAYVAGVLGVVMNRELRWRTGIRSLLLVSGVTLLVMISLDREAQHHYLVHFVVWMISLTSVAGVWWWDRRSVPRWALVAGLLVIVMVQMATTGRRVSQRAYSTTYLATTDYLKEHAQGRGLVMGSAELAFELGDMGLVDDQRLGFRSGKRPNFIVIDGNRYAEWIPQYEQREPETYRYIRGLMDGEFHEVLENGAYQVYARRSELRSDGQGGALSHKD
jgi:Dolichyl-phosphate-mannose-protein mannosyltransferase